MGGRSCVYAEVEICEKRRACSVNRAMFALGSLLCSLLSLAQIHNNKTALHFLTKVSTNVLNDQDAHRKTY